MLLYSFSVKQMCLKIMGQKTNSFPPYNRSNGRGGIKLEEMFCFFSLLTSTLCNKMHNIFNCCIIDKTLIIMRFNTNSMAIIKSHTLTIK